MLQEAILGAKGLVDLLNRVEYISMVHHADRDLTEQYKAAVAVVEEKEAKLKREMDNLLVKQETFLGQQAEIEAMVKKLEGEQAEFAQQLADAQKQVKKYKQIIAEQDEIIRKEEEARRKAEEERKRKEEEARKKAEEEKKKQEANQTTNKVESSNGSVSGKTLVNYVSILVTTQSLL